MKKLLPPVLFLLFLAAMLLANRLLPAAAVIPSPARHIGCALAAIGIALLIAGRVQFARARTNIYTFDEPGTLVTGGAFRLSRHPMYLGFALVLAGAAIMLGSIAALLLVPPFVLITDRWYIAFEERWLREKFGDAYRRYAARTRRWI